MRNVILSLIIVTLVIGLGASVAYAWYSYTVNQTMGEANGQMATQVTELSAEIGQLKSEIKGLRSEIASVKDRNVELEADNSDIELRMAEQSVELSRLLDLVALLLF